MAWTWFNNVGNRELYMNCINTQLTGGDGSEMDQFPTMFVANVVDTLNPNAPVCPTTEEFNVQFPYPGTHVTTATPSGTATNYPLAKPTGAGCENDGAPASGSGGAEPAPSPSPSYGSPSAPPLSSSFASASSSFSYAALPTASSSGSPSGSCPYGKVPCPNLGTMYCIGDYQWGLCDIGNCMVPMAVAPRTHCSNGQILKRSHIRHAARHGARRL